MYSIHNEGKSVVAEGFVRTLKTKIERIKSLNIWLEFQRMCILIN